MEKITLVLAITVLVSGCADIDSLYSVPPTIVSRVSEDYSCFSVCIKNLTINSNGAIIYYEKLPDGTVKQGASAVDKAHFAELLDLYHTSFFLLDDMYSCGSGSNTTRFYFRNDTVYKTVTVHGSCDPVPALEAVNAHLNELRDSKISYEDKNLYATFNRTVTDIRMRLLELFSPKN